MFLEIKTYYWETCSLFWSYTILWINVITIIAINTWEHYKFVYSWTGPFQWNKKGKQYINCLHRCKTIRKCALTILLEDLRHRCDLKDKNRVDWQMTHLYIVYRIIVIIDKYSIVKHHIKFQLYHAKHHERMSKIKLTALPWHSIES